MQINGKVRDRVLVHKDLPDAEIEKLVLSREKVAEALAGKTVAKVIVIRNKLVNIVVK